MNQLSFDDFKREQSLLLLPSRTAYIDECGNFGFDFNNGGSKYYILCAVVAKNSDIDELHTAVSVVKQNNGFGQTEMKSSAIGNNYRRRSKIIAELLPIVFRVILFVADKQAFISESPLTSYRQSFIKFLHQRLYNVLYNAYPKLRIVEDQIGTSEFQESFKKYVREHRPENLFNEYDFDYTDSKDSLLVQLADIVGGTISKVYIDDHAPNYLEMLKGKIICIENFPNKTMPYFASAISENTQYDKSIFEIAVQCVNSFIAKYEHDESLEKKLQIALLRYLLFQVYNVDANNYISSHQLLSILEEYANKRIRPNYLYRRIIAPLRDAGVILASCTHGYKIPISVEDIITYLNQTHTVVSPMLHRIEICRNLIRQKTDNAFDVLDNPAFLKYKNFFD
ncbi:hypothetical protein CAFE_23350 [Caprobacter fermentans]|uniref:DUF3800 domain-containing protein n=1 Tax=Caproicibacter fermentans TaxID=2576756 RepID=A0A6N8I0F3_9FIRM|nr:DUF3800 domain-containing protein [Caproicibacter fermentans]MVB11614.1 hypothetical protein [Caproicibacter fermentans]